MASIEHLEAAKEKLRVKTHELSDDIATFEEQLAPLQKAYEEYPRKLLESCQLYRRAVNTVLAFCKLDEKILEARKEAL